MENETRPVTQLPQSAQSLLGHYQTCISQLEYDPAREGGTDKELVYNLERGSPWCWVAQVGPVIPNSLLLRPLLDVPKVFPTGKLDADLQQVDLRKTNSWRLKLGDIQTSEMLEVQLVNSVAPFVLCNRLVDLMKRDVTGNKHIVNVSAMEGKFLRFKKDSRHPHTNMAKASLNMLTHPQPKSWPSSGFTSMPLIRVG